MEEKKKIVFYYPDMYLGGVEMAIINLAKRIYKDYELFFFYKGIHNLDIGKELRKYGLPINISSYPTDEPFVCDVLVYCSLWLEQDNAQKFIKAKKRILWSHAMVPQGGGTKFYNLPFMRIIDDIVSVSKAADESIPKFLYETNKKLKGFHVIHNILNTEEIKAKSMLPAPALELAKDLNICTVARISAEKGWHRVKFICDYLRQKGIVFKWFIIGEGYHDDQVMHAKALLQNYPQVEFLGGMINPFPIVKQMDYMALLSDYESWGLVITEAKILGVPSIVTNFPASVEQITDGENGFIVSLRNLTSYADLPLKLYENKKRLKAKLKDFDYEKVNQETVAEWHKLFRE